MTWQRHILLQFEVRLLTWKAIKIKHDFFNCVSLHFRLSTYIAKTRGHGAVYESNCWSVGGSLSKRVEWSFMSSLVMIKIFHKEIERWFWPLLPNSSQLMGSCLENIAWTAAVSHSTAVPHSSHHLVCMLEWSRIGHWSVCTNYSPEHFNGWLTKIPNRR